MHRDLPSTFEDGISDYSLLVYLEAGVGSELHLELGSGPGPDTPWGLSIVDEIVESSNKPPLVLSVHASTAVIFSQRYIHSGVGGSRLVLRADIVQPGSWVDGGTASQIVAQTLFRNAEMAELAGFQSMAAEMYERSTHIRLCAAKYPDNRTPTLHPRALFFVDHYMELVTGCTACIARSGTSYLFFHGKLYDDDAWPQATVEPVVSQAAVFVLANMLNRDLPPLVFQTPARIQDTGDDTFDFDVAEMGAIQYGNGSGFATFAEASDEDDYAWWREKDASPWPAFITAKHLIWNVDNSEWVSFEPKHVEPTTYLGVVKVALFTKQKEYQKCYCGCDGDGPVPPPKLSNPYERMSTAVFEAVPSTVDIPAPTVVFEDESSGHIWFDLEPHRTSTFHHAACTGGYKVVGKTEMGSVQHAVRCTMKFVLQAGGLLCIVARPFVVM
jgi:hypothetical protein